MKKHLLLLVTLSLFCFNSFATLQTVTVQNYSFTPSTFNINLGDSVKWVWVSGQHTTTSTTIPSGATTWNHNINSSSTSFLYVPNKVGTYNYHCAIHPTMMIASFVVNCPTPNITITNPLPIIICAGGTAQLNSSASGGGPFTYQWQSQFNGGNWTNIGSATNANYTTTAATSTMSYRVIVTNSCQNTGISQSVTVTPQILSLGVTPFQSSVCAGSCTNLTAALTNGGTVAGTYAWSPSAGLNSTSGATVTACPTSATTYTVVFTSSVGCTASANAFVGVNISPTIVGTSSSYTVCGGTSIQLNATGGVTYSWSPSGGLSNPNISNPTATPTGNTTYSVTGVNANGCSGIDTVVIHVGAPFQLTQTHTNATCGNSNGSIDLSIIGGSGVFIYHWSNNATTQDLANIPSGNYAVTVTGFGGCMNVLTVAVTSLGGPTLTSTHVNVSCNGMNNGSIDLTVSGGNAPYTYQWNNGSNSQDINNLAAGTYIVTVTDANNCSSVNNAVITQPTAIALTETHVNSSCGNANGSINLSVTGGTGTYTYHWTPNNATTQDLTGLVAGTYEVIVTDANGCTAFLGVSITNISTITLTQTHTNASCGNATGSINLTISPAGNYNHYWSNGATTEDITGLVAGSYTVTVYSTGTGCVATLTVNITNGNSGTLTETHVNATCSGFNGSINLSVSPAGNYNYIWTNGATTQDLNNIPAGTYSVTVSNNSGCSNSTTVTVTGTYAPVVTAVSGNASCGLNNGYAESAAASGVPPYTYLWNTGATTSFIQSLAPGVYSVTVFDQNQCSGTYTVTVGQNGTAPVASIQSGTASFCSGGNAVLVVSPTGASYQWKKNGTTIAGATNITYTASVSGTFTCTVVYTCGSPTSNGIVITKLATPTATITANGPTTFCAGQSVTLNVNIQAGVSYQWKKNGAVISGATNTSYVATTAGNYRCLVTKNATGCTKLSGNITVTVNCRLEESASTGNTFKYYPNPFNTELTVQLNSVSTVAVYNVLGQKKIEMKDVNGEIKLGQDLQPGIYILEVRENGTVVSSQRIVKVD